MKYIFLIGLFVLSSCGSTSRRDFCKIDGQDTADCQQINFPPLNKR